MTPVSSPWWHGQALIARAFRRTWTAESECSGRRPRRPYRAEPGPILPRSLACLALFVSATTILAQPAAPLAIDRYRVERIHAERRIVTFSRDPADAVKLDDRIVFLADDGSVALGRVFALDDRHFAAKMDPGPLPAPEDFVARLPAGIDTLLRPWLPDGTSLWCRVDAAVTASTAVWLDRGANSGFRTGDRLFALRRDLPVARVEINRVYPDAALAAMTPLVADASLIPGDWARLWPAPADAVDGLQSIRVLNARPSEHGLEVWIPADRRDGLALGDRWEIRRDGAYIDLVEVVEFRHRFAIARGGQAFARERVQVGDEAVRRRPAAIAAGRCAMRVFRVEGDYCLLNAGENEGLVEGRTVNIMNPDGGSSEWIIETVKIDYAGARAGVRSIGSTDDVSGGATSATSRPVGTSQPADANRTVASRPAATQSTTRPAKPVPIQPWAAAYLAPPPPTRPALGRIARLLDGASLGLVEWRNETDPPPPGTVLRLEPPTAGPASRPNRIHTAAPPPAAALVVVSGKQRAVVYIPAATHTIDVASGWNLHGP